MIRVGIRQLRRVTSSGAYYAEIDGLRFIAIASVVAYHLNGYFGDRELNSEFGNRIQSLVSSCIGNGHRGVEIFFAISGLVLALPFAAHYIVGEKSPKLAKYYLRRLTRLEPPYIISLLICFFCISLRLHEAEDFGRYVKSFIASLVYAHNFVFPRGELPLTNPVTWSLEIEVQFYVIAPILALLFAVNRVARRIIFLSLIAVWSVASRYHLLPHVSLVDFAQYFLVGFIVADLFVSNSLQPAVSGGWRALYVVLGLGAFVAIWVCPSNCLALAVLVLFVCVFKSSFLRSIMGGRTLSTIGGMCYSIYLVHWPIITTFGGKIKGMTDSYIVGMLMGLILVSSASLIFFIFIERPFMARQRHLRSVNDGVALAKEVA